MPLARMAARSHFLDSRQREEWFREQERRMGLPHTDDRQEDREDGGSADEPRREVT